MKIYPPKRFAGALLSALLLISCGNGGGGTMMAGGGIDGTGIISVGSISAFGSIVVNGTEFDTSQATIIVGGEELGAGDDIALENLDIGKVVIVDGTLSADGSSVMADRVRYNDNVAGPVEIIRDIDAATKEIVVLGQTVIVNNITKFKETTVDTLLPDDVVEVSGFVDDTGAIRATFLEKIGDITTVLEYEVTGFVANLDTGLKTFEINDLTVVYSSADTSGLPDGEPAEGLWVEVEGTLDASDGEMFATVIELEDELDAVDTDQIEVTGFVTDFVSILEFSVGNQVVQTDADTFFVDGTAEDIDLGVKLEVEGSRVDGVLFADEIEFWYADQIEVEGLVTDFVSVSEFTVGEQVVNTDAETVFDGGTPEDIVFGVLLEVKGSLTGSILVADKVSFEEQ